MRRLVVFGGSFNPAAKHHLAILKYLRFHDFPTAKFKIVPCGGRPDKETTNDIDSVHRATMVEITFGELLEADVEIDLFDVYRDTFTPTYELQARYENEGDVWHMIGTDLIAGGERGASPIQQTWERGADLWTKMNFIVIVRAGFPFQGRDLPPRSVTVFPGMSGSSTEIRRRVANGLPIGHLVVPKVEEYINHHKLYRPQAQHLSLLT